MNLSLLQAALLGTDALSFDLHDPLLAPFVEVFVNSRNSVAKNAALAIGLAMLVDQATPFKGDGESLFSLNEVDCREYPPVEVADAILTIIKKCLPTSVSVTTEFRERPVYPVVPLLRTLARYGLRFPPERATAFIDVFKSEARDNLDPALVAFVAPPNVRELVRHETSLYDAIWQIPLFLQPDDVPLGVSPDEIERVFFDEESLISTKAAALKALRALDPDRGRKALETFLSDCSNDSWSKYAKYLLPCAMTRVGLADAPFLNNALEKGGGSFAAGQAIGESLARLRDPEYLASIIEYADCYMSRDGDFSIPNASARRALQKLGLYFNYATPQSCDDRERKFRERVEAWELAKKNLVEELLKRIPLEHWEKFFQASPEEILAKMARHENYVLVLAGLRASYLFYGGPRRWEEPLDRRLSAEQSDENEADWLGAKFRRVDGGETGAIRSLVDQLRSIYAGSTTFPQSLALLLALNEPYPWRDEFADFYDSVLSKALESFGEDASRPTKTVVQSRYTFTVNSNLWTMRRKTFFERLLDQGERVAPIDCSNSYGRGDWNSTTDFARLLWTNATPVLHLAPRRLREKLFELGRLFDERCVRCSPLLERSPFFGRRALREKLPLFEFESLYHSGVFSKAVETMENYFLSLPKLE